MATTGTADMGGYSELAALKAEAMTTGPVAASDYLIVLPVVICFIFGAGLLMMRKRTGRQPWVAIPGLALLFSVDLALLAKVATEGTQTMMMGGWKPPFGIAFTVDLMGALFVAVTGFVALACGIYAVASISPTERRYGFYPFLFLMIGGVSGAFLTGDIFNLYVWLEVLLIGSFGLLILGSEHEQLDGATKYCFLNLVGTTLFLITTAYLYGVFGTLNMADIMRVASTANPAAMAGVAALLMLAFGMKAAAFPVNAWLPASYHTPPAAISALFAGLLTKVGAYAMLRALVVVLPASRDMLEPALAWIAIATLVIAPLGAIAETNLRRAIGFIVIGGIGAVLSGLAMPSLNGVAGSGLYIFHAILTMTALYMVAGLVEKTTGQTDTRRMGGLYAASVPLSVLFILMVLASAGVPPFLGFWPKLLLLEAGLAQGVTGTAPGWLGTAMVLALLINAVLTLIAGTRIWAHIFWRSGPEGQGSEHASIALAPFDNRGKIALGATTFLVAGIVLAGIWPGPLMAGISEGAADIVDPARYVAATGLAGDEL